MNTGRTDYDAELQDTRPEGERIPDDEPVFLLRAKDALAPDLIEEWAEELDMANGDPETIHAAYRQADAMRRYADEYYGGGKVPDAPQGSLR